MAFPDEPRDIVTEIYVNGDWVDISTDVRGDADGITISHGRPNEASDPQPSSCSFVLNNPDGHYSPDWPEGDYYGTLDRNTPTRTTINIVKDTFTRTVVDGWGSSDTGHNYSLSGVGGTVAAADMDVAAGVGTLSIPVADATRYVQINTAGVNDSYYDVDVAVTVSVPFTNVTGATIAPLSIAVRDQGGSTSVWAQVLINTSEQIFLRIWDGVANFEIGAEVELDELTHTSSQALRCRFQAEGHLFRAKVWPVDNTEPYGWHVVAYSPYHPAAGLVSIFGWVLTGNTNAKPIVLSYDDLIVRSLVHAGEVSSWPADWDTSGNDVRATVESYGISRRLGQGTSPVQSTLYRGILGLTTPALAYWPGEDGADSTYLSSALGGPPMTVHGDIDFASYSAVAASSAIPVLQGCSLVGTVPTYTSTGKVQLRFLLHVPTDYPAHTWMIGLQCAGGQSWDLKYQPGGALSFDLWVNAILIFTTGPIGFNVLNRDTLISIELEQDGGSIDWAFRTLEVGETVGFSQTGTTAGRTLGRVQRVLIDPAGDMPGAAIGHINIRKEVTNLFDLDTELTAYRNERAVTRIGRLCDQEGVSISYVSNPVIESEPMGSQRPLTLFQLLKECADADRGTLYDSKGELGLTYRERSAIYNQTDAFTLDYGGGQVGEPFKPVRDDQATRNDITVNRTSGGYAVATLTEGRLSVQEPSEGGAGRYDTSLTLNVYSDEQLDNLAGFELRKGTVTKTRYPSVTLNLHNPNVAADGDLSVNALDLAVDDRFSIINPKAGQTADDISLIARGWSRYLSNFIDTITINAAPAEPYDVLRLDGDLTYPSKWDTGGSELAAPVTTTATSFSVTITGTQLWTTDAGQMPIPILIGGEEVSVTAISGASSPQTFTVTRSVNGIVKAHAAGTSLSLRTRPVFGL